MDYEFPLNNARWTGLGGPGPCQSMSLSTHARLVSTTSGDSRGCENVLSQRKAERAWFSSRGLGRSFCKHAVKGFWGAGAAIGQVCPTKLRS